jgi:PTH1 family peptidyl-tRNA hydrolase
VIFSKIFGRFFEKKRLQPDVKPEVLIFGLGNPGEKYSGTRHNVGFCVVDELAESSDASEPLSCCESEIRTVALKNGKTIALVKPLTYMNLSGGAVSACTRKYGLNSGQCLVIVDDFNIALGKIRFRKDGSHGGHNGLRSIAESVGTDFPRLRVGIGPLPQGVSIIDFVLGRFEKHEQGKVREVVKTCAEAVIFALESGIETAMNKYN